MVQVVQKLQGILSIRMVQTDEMDQMAYLLHIQYNFFSMSLPINNSKNASFDDNQIPSLLGKDPSTNETVAIMAQN